MDRRLNEAVFRGDVEAIQKLIEEDSSIVKQTIEGSLHTILHLAARFGHVELVREIVKLFPEMVSAENRDLETPLHEACREGRVEIVRILLENDPWVAYKTNLWDKSVLYVACEGRRIEVVRHLLNNVHMLLMLEVDMSTTSLHVAASLGHTAGDWLQGPYVYYLYTTYGYRKGDIGHLFIAGFGSSMLFGTIVGSLADKQGRKRACVTYCITYILSCITKHSPQYKILMVGRILGGIATSLLFSSFESWLVAEHNKRGFDQQWLSLTFSKAIFLGNGLVAILAGLFGNVLVDTLNLGPVSPFDAASCFLAIGMVIILSSWTENYGDTSENKNLITQFKSAAVAIASDEKIALLGAIQSLFEGSMYTFVFLWTPALSPNSEDIPHGFIFATFMLSSMLGSSLASRLLARSSLKVESYMQIVFAVSAVCLFIPVITSFLVTPSNEKGGGITFSGCIQLLGFCAFEACVGIFWPSIMKMRSQYIPEEARSTIMNFFRIPLNIFVCVVLYNVDSFPITVMFGMCSIFLLLASILQKRLSAVVEKSKPQDWTTHKEREMETTPLNA